MPLIRLAAVLACALQILLVTDAFAQIGATPAQKSDPTVVQSVARSADIARVEGVEDGTKGGERIMVDVPVGSIECSVDPNATKTRVSAEFKVDGKDAADALGLAIMHAHAASAFAAMARVAPLNRRQHAQFRQGRTY